MIKILAKLISKRPQEFITYEENIFGVIAALLPIANSLKPLPQFNFHEHISSPFSNMYAMNFLESFPSTPLHGVPHGKCPICALAVR